MKKYSMFVSPNAPDEIQNVIYHLAKRLAELGYFVSVVDQKASAEAIRGTKDGGGKGEVMNKATVENWGELESVHPTWFRCGAAARAWHARRANAMQESEFVVVWTPKGEETPDETSLSTGGIGQAIRLAAKRGIPLFNLQRDDAMNRIGQLVK